jgi:hypothetical protein
MTMTTSGIVMALGLDWPWMLGWLPVVALPFIVVQLAVARARPVRWAPIDIVANAARRAGLTREGFSTPLLLMRAAMLLLAVLAAARPFLAAPAAALRAVQTDRASAGSRRIVFVEPGAAVAASRGGTMRLAIEALSTAADAKASPPRAVEMLALSELSAASPALSGALTILPDGIVPTRAAADGLAESLHRGAAVIVLVGPDTAGGPARQWLSEWLDRLAGLRIAGVAAGAGQRIAVTPSLADFPGVEKTGDAFVALPGPSVSWFADLAIDPRDAAPMTVLARTLPEGSPLVVEARVGAGRLCVSALPLALGAGPPVADAWSDLAAWPVFVPLVDRLVTRLIAPGDAAASVAMQQPPVAGDRIALLDFLRRSLPPARLLLAAALTLAALDPLLSWLFARRHLRAAMERSFMWIGWSARAAIVAALGGMFVSAGDASRTDDTGVHREIALVIDVSPSMATKDVETQPTPGGRMTRLAAVTAAIDRASDTHPAFAAAQISFFTAARDLAPLEPRRAGGGPIEAVAVGPDASRIGDAVEQLLLGAPGRYAAIAIASDGMITSGASWEHAGRLAADRGVPLFAIPVGGPGGEAEPADSTFTLIAAEMPRVVWRDEQVQVAFEAEGPPEAEQLPVVLEDRGGHPRAAGILRPDPADRAGGGTTASRYSGIVAWKPTHTGMQTLVVRPDGVPAANGAAAGMVGTTLVVEEPVSVLVVDAVPRFEFRFLEHLLASDRRLRVESCLLDGRSRSADEGTRQRLAAPLPKTAADWSRFDVVVLGDICGDDLPAESAKGLVEAVQRDGVGVAWLPGRRWRGAAPAASPLDEWLPASPGTSPKPHAAHAGRFQWLPAASQAGWQPGMRFGPPASKIEDVWTTAGGVSLAPTARVLAITTSDRAAPEPAIILDRRGAGTILGTLFSTWRLRGPTNDEVRSMDHAMFWRHAIAQLAEGRILARHTPATLALEPSRITAGASVRIAIEPTWPAADLRDCALVHTRPDGRQERANARSGTVWLDHLEPGWHSVALGGMPASPAITTAGPSHVSLDFLVLPPQPERPGPPADAAVFAAAAVTSGGDCLSLGSIGSLPERVTSVRAARATNRARLHGPRPAWLHGPRPAWLHGPTVTSLLMLALVAACAIEWTARVRRGMP